MKDIHLLPFGVYDLEPEVFQEPGPPRKVRCYVAGCDHILRVPTRTDRGEACPDHGIVCHFSGGKSKTYSFVDVRRNIIVSPDLFTDRIVGHPFKFESHRLGLENSEDALTWNVFCSLQKAKCLHEIASWVTGLDVGAEPFLFMWGICLTNDSFEPWNLLIAARQRFETNLPVERPLTEPDIALFLPGQYLILIEAKFTSPNPFYIDGPRKNASSLTKDELLGIYQDRELRTLNLDRGKRAERVHYQLWRNMVFAEWMASADGRQTRVYHANLTRAGQEKDSVSEFRQLLNPEFADRFVHLAWEDIYHLCAVSLSELDRLRRYLEIKTTRLQPAFRLSRTRHTECHTRKQMGIPILS